MNLSNTEWSVMECLWEHGALTGKEASELLEAKEGWSRSTTLTLLRRMEEKEAVTSEIVDGLKTFRPLVTRETAAVKETEKFLDKVYNGSVSMMVTALTKKEALSKDEIDELYQILRKLEGE